MCVVRILDGEVMQAELLLQFFKQRFVGFNQTDPDKGIRALQHIADRIETDVSDALAIRTVGNAIGDHRRAVDRRRGSGGENGNGLFFHVADDARPRRRGQCAGRGMFQGESHCAGLAAQWMTPAGTFATVCNQHNADLP